MFKEVVCGLVAVGLTLGNTASFAQVQTGAQAVRMTPRQALYHYAKTGNLKGLQSLRSRGYSIDLNDVKGNSALCEATWRADKTAVVSLLKAGANTNAQCMQKIPAQYKQAVGLNSAPTYANAGSTAGTGATASSAAGAAATGLSTGAMVGIGVGAAALIGGGIALAASGGGGSKSSSTPVPPVDLCVNINCDQPNQRCEAGQCICDDGFKMFDGTCYATISCGAHGTQNKDSCVCDAGYAGADCSTCAADYILQNGVCYAKLSCPANSSQQADSCVCDSGYDKYGTRECHETLTCDAHSHQQADSCVCNDGYVMQGGVCTFDSCPANQYQNGEECLACPANSTSVAGSTSISQCICDAGYTKTPAGTCMNETADVAGYGYTFIAEPTSANGVYNIKDTGYKVFSNTKDLTYSFSGSGFPTYSEHGKSVELQTILRADTQGAQINNKGTITSSLDTNLISVRNGAVAVNYGTLRSTQKGTSETLITAAMYADRTSSLYNYGDIYMNRGIGMFVRGYWTQSDKDPNFKQTSEVNVVNTKNILLNPDYFDDSSNSIRYGAGYGIFVDLARDPSYTKSVSINIENSGTITANGGIYLYDLDTIDPEEKFGKDVLPHELNISILNTGTITAGTASGIATSEVGSRFLDYGSHIEVVNGQCYDSVMGYVRECPYKDGQSSIKILDNNYATLDNIKMKVTNEGTITAAKQGISAPGTIVNKGTIKSSLAGIRAVQETTRIENYKDIIAATTGISAFGDKELEILNEGTIMAGNFDESVLEDNRANGILANAIKSIINKGQITSKGTGIDMNAISLLNSGTINAQEYGVKFSGTSFTNSGLIDSQTRGVSTVGDFFNTSTGKIYGRNGEGVLASGFVKNEGEIHGGTTGISIGGSSTEFSKLVNMGDIYATNTGLYAKHAIVENYGTITVSEAKGLGISIVDSGKVNFTNEKGGVIGLTSSGIGIQITAFDAKDVINIKNEGSINTTDGTAIKAYDVISAATVSIINNGDIASLKGRGIEGKYLKVKNEEKGFIRGTISGLDVSNTTLENHGNISSVGQDGYETGGFVFVNEKVGSSIQTHRYYSGIGVYATSSTVINKGKIEAKNVGIFGKNSIIENYGTITITGSEGAGIVASGGTVYNEGSITFSADNEQEGKVGVEAGYCVTHECYYVSEERAAIISGAPNGGGWYKTRTGSGTTSDPYVYSDFYAKVNRFIVLQDNAKLLTSGTLSSEGTLNLNAFSPDGTGSVSLIKGGQLEGKNIVGNLHIDASNVKGGFANDYTVASAIHALDASELRLMSDSVLFTAKLADNGSDVVMTRRSFNDLVANKSLAGFLEANYAAGNGEGFFNMLKNIGTASEFAGTLSDITAKDTFSRFAYEDLTAMREVNFAMNEAMFANDDKPLFETTGSVNGFGFKSDNNSQSQYALATKRVSPRFKVGYAMSNTTLNSDDDNDTTRRNQLFQVFAPIGYERAGVKLISTPQIGFARGHYTRASDGNGSYKGVIEKRTFALMNEARYPMRFGKYEVAPTVEFNAIAYNQKGREDAKAYALTMPSDTNVSIEGGVGLRLSRAAEVGHDSKLSMTAGVMMYREFADPYNIKMGMQGMDGSFELYDERSPYRAVASFGFGYDLGSVNMYGSIQHYMQSDTYTKAKAGFKLGF